jgi:hypothetical protein
MWRPIFPVFPRTLAIVTALGLLSATAGIAAGETPDSQTVSEAAGDDRKPGHHIGGFRLRPTLSIGQRYDDNVFTTDRDPQADWITLLSPQLKLDSTWARHSLRFNAGAERGHYWRFEDEDHLDYWSSAEGRLDLSETTELHAGLGMSYDHEDRDSPDTRAGALEPTTFSRLHANVGIRTTIAGTTYRMGGTFEQFDFDDVPSAVGRIIQDDRNRTLSGLGIRAERPLADDQAIFLQLLYNERDYELNRDQNGFQRDSRGYRAAIGLRKDLGPGDEAEIYLGVIRQEYTDPRFDDLRSADFGGRLTLGYTNGSRLIVKLQRSLNETTEIGSPGYLSSKLSARFDHRATQRLTPYLNLGYTHADYLDSERRDETYSAGTGVKYFLTPNVYLTAGASHTWRDSRDAATATDSNEFDKTVYFLTLSTQLYPLQ